MYIGFGSRIFIKSLDAYVVAKYINFLNQFFIYSEILGLGYAKSLPLHKGDFFVHICLVNFPDKR